MNTLLSQQKKFGIYRFIVKKYDWIEPESFTFIFLKEIKRKLKIKTG